MTRTYYLVRRIGPYAIDRGPNLAPENMLCVKYVRSILPFLPRHVKLTISDEPFEDSNTYTFLDARGEWTVDHENYDALYYAFDRTIERFRKADETELVLNIKLEPIYESEVPEPSY